MDFCLMPETSNGKQYFKLTLQDTKTNIVTKLSVKESKRFLDFLTQVLMDREIEWDLKEG